LTPAENGAKVQSKPFCVYILGIGRWSQPPKLAGMKLRANWAVAAWVSFTAPRIHRLPHRRGQDYPAFGRGHGNVPCQLVERFQTEARAAGLLTHPNIVVIYDVGESDGVYYITMELVNGKSLQSVLDSGEKFPLRRLLRIMEQICSALQFAHDHRVVHRDIKPANIMLTGEDFVKITDFGTAQIMQYGTAQQTSATGTPAYMSPEQIKAKPSMAVQIFFLLA